jgi:putative PIN family toxin of toxin-antitoxin system
MRVVLDTNLIVSRALAPNDLSATILSFMQEDTFTLLISEAILAEYQASLAKKEVQKRHQLKPSEIAELIDDIRETSILVEPEIHLDVVKDDPDDNKFIECAVAGDAEIIVSSDPDLLDVGSYNGIQIVRPAVFLHLLEQQNAA